MSSSEHKADSADVDDGVGVENSPMHIPPYTATAYTHPYYLHLHNPRPCAHPGQSPLPHEHTVPAPVLPTYTSTPRTCSAPPAPFCSVSASQSFRFGTSKMLFIGANNGKPTFRPIFVVTLCTPSAPKHRVVPFVALLRLARALTPPSVAEVDGEPSLYIRRDCGPIALMLTGSFGFTSNAVFMGVLDCPVGTLDCLAGTVTGSGRMVSTLLG